MVELLANAPPPIHCLDWLSCGNWPGSVKEQRGAAAPLLIADGLPITAVSAMLGHALTSTTLNNYAHVLPGAERLTADAMERLLG
jgi:hypothetical protein